MLISSKVGCSAAGSNRAQNFQENLGRISTNPVLPTLERAERLKFKRLQVDYFMVYRQQLEANRYLLNNYLELQSFPIRKFRIRNNVQRRRMEIKN